VVGTERVEAAVVTDGATTRTIRCEMVCSGYALVPATELGTLFGCTLDQHAIVCDASQRTTVPGVFCAGEAAGIGGVDSAVVQGEIAGLAAVGREPPEGLLRERQRHTHFARRMEQAFALRPELRDLPEPDTIVCRCEDVRHADLGGFTCAAEAKLVTRAGMGACQARVCGPAQRFLYGWGPDSIRPPVLPARVSTMMQVTASAATQGDE
jgi:D-hydroxyproline dehydrogenase subunit alpha